MTDRLTDLHALATAEHQSRNETWARIEREAHDQVQAELDVDLNTPLEFGDGLRWIADRDELVLLLPVEPDGDGANV